eukprot:TRINITY_DN12735_c0_g1_i1.p1 TRINITY_DN12735_c0_g1~~TRINITY_DN12735_c0_g1_i1.p1  ORF type:complete len:620 (+),score=139.29 TRINITY_DN12735_c0_g1_i1:36-1895(+)
MDILRDAAACEELGSSMLAKTLTAAQDISNVRLLCNQHFEEFKKLNRRLVTVLNTDSSLKNKTSALAALTTFARYKAGRDDLYDVIKTIDVGFENTLKEREQASESFGTALGKLHSTMLVLMMRVFGYRIRGLEVVEYANGKTAFAIDLLLEICKVPSYEPEIVANCCTAIADLADVESRDVKTLRERIDSLIDLIQKYNVVSTVSGALQRYLNAAANKSSSSVMPNAVHTAVISFVVAIFNLYTFSSQGLTATALRQSLLISTDFLTSCIPAYIRLCIDEISRCIDLTTSEVVHPITPVLAVGITHSLKVLAFGSFHMGCATQLRVSNIVTCILLGLPIKEFVIKHLELYAYLFHYNVNIDALCGEHNLPEGIVVTEICKSSTILRTTGQVLAALPNETAVKLWKLVASGSTHIPIAKDAVSFDLLGNLFDVSINSEAQRREPPKSIAVSGDIDCVTDELDRRMASLEADRESSKQEESKDLRLLGDLPSLLSTPMPKPSVMADTTQNPIKPPTLPKKAQEVWVAAAAEGSSAPAEFACAINGHFLRHPMRAPSGKVFEKETIELWLKQVGSTDPITGDHLTLDMLKADEDLMARILQWQIGQNTSLNKVDESNLYQF